MEKGAYQLDALRPYQIDRAYLLIHAVVPDLDLADWQQAVASVFRHEQIVTATNTAGTVQGLCIYRVRDHKVAGRLLDIPFLVVASASDPDGVAGALLEHIKAKAREERCRSIRIWSLGADNWRHMRDPAFFERLDHGLVLKVEANRNA